MWLATETRHQRRVHPQMTFNYVYRCSVCDREFDTGRRASNHYQTHKRGGTEAAPAGSAPRSTRSGTSSPPDDGPEGTLSPMELIRGLVGDPPKTTPAQHSLTPRSMDERLSSRKRGQNSASSQHPSTVVRRSSITDAGSDLAASPPETMHWASRGGPLGRGLGPATLPTPWLLGAWLRNQAVIRSAIWRVPRPQCQWCGVRVVTRGRVPTISRSLQAGTGGKTRPSPNTPQRNARKALLGLVTWMREISRRSNTPLRNARLPHESPVTRM